MLLSFIISTLHDEKDIIIYALVFFYIATGGTRKPSLPSYEGMSCNNNYHHHYYNHIHISWHTSTCYIVIELSLYNRGYKQIIENSHSQKYQC